MSITETIKRLKLIRLDVGYSEFDAAIKSMNRERLHGNEREKRKKYSWGKYKSLYQRQKAVCWWCGNTMPLIKGQIELDHFDPNREDFEAEENLSVLHKDCNRQKGPKDLINQAEILGITTMQLIKRFNDR